MLTLVFRSVPRGLRLAVPAQSVRHYTDSIEALAIAKKKSAQIVNSVPENTSISEAIWPPVIEPLDIDTTLFHVNPSDYFNDGKEVNIDQVSRECDPEGRFSVFTGRLKDLLASAEAHDPLYEVLHGLGMTQVQYRRDQVPEINWNYYRKVIPDQEFVAELEKNYNETLKETLAMTSEESPLVMEVRATNKRVEALFVEQMTRWQADGRALIDEIGRIEAQQREIIAFGSRLEDVFVEDELADEQELDRQLDADMLAGKWTVEDEDIPEPPAGSADNTLEKALTGGPTSAELEQKVLKSIWG